MILSGCKPGDSVFLTTLWISHQKHLPVKARYQPSRSGPGTLPPDKLEVISISWFSFAVECCSSRASSVDKYEE